MLAAHTAWAGLATVLAAALLGLASRGPTPGPGTAADAVVVAASALGSVSQGWLWLGLLVLLLLLTGLASSLAHVSVLVSSLPCSRRLLAAPPVPAVPAAAAAAGLVLVAGAGAREALVAASAAATSATEVVTAPLPVVVRVALVSSPLRSSSVIIHSGGLLSPQPLQFFFLALQSLSLKPLPLSFELH